jgi:hypothetical protein
MILLALLTLQGPVTIVIDGHRPASEAVVGTAAMKYLPFDVPKGVTSIDIAPEILDKEGDRDTVDLGLFDPHGTTVRGFRGWQGGTRRPATITGSFATTSPWALAGPLPSGRWNLAQYYLKASSKGLDYRYTITFRFDGPRPPHEIPTPSAPLDPGGTEGWYIGDLHAHSLSSDGALPLLDLVKLHRQAGYDFMASTEHNTPAAHWRLAETMRAVPGITLIPGTEFTTPGGHTNLIGLKPDRWIDFRIDPGDGRLPKLFKDARRQGAMIEINHPFADCTSCTWTFPAKEWKDAHGIEVWNSVWDPTDDKALALWDSMLREGKRVYAYGGADFHRAPAPLSPATRVWARSRRASDLVDALRHGHAIVTSGPSGPSLRFEATRGGEHGIAGDVLAKPGKLDTDIEVRNAIGAILTVHSRSGVVTTRTVDADGMAIRLLVTPDQYLRLELRTPAGQMLALTNPIFTP